MYWMLLPPSANTERHLEDMSLPLCGYWIGVFRAGMDAVRHLLPWDRR
jgi:hypothetical protein